MEIKPLKRTEPTFGCTEKKEPPKTKEVFIPLTSAQQMAVDIFEKQGEENKNKGFQ